MQLSYGFASNVLPSQVPNPALKSKSTHDGGSSNLYPSLGWAFTGDSNTRSIDSVSEDSVISQEEIPCQAIMVPIEDQPIYPWVSFFFHFVNLIN